MGWSFEHRDAGHTDREIFQEKMGDRYTILGCATVNRSTFYAAARDNRTGEVSGFVALVQWAPGSYYNWGYKDMAETWGPIAECPASVLDLLTPLPECAGCRPLREYDYCPACTARQWREDSRAIAFARAAAATVKTGQLVRFARPVEFTSGVSLSTLMFRGRDLFSEQDGYGRYRVTGWRTMSNWTLVAS